MVKTRALLPGLALALLLPLGAAADDPAKFLPFMSPRLEAARYAPANEEFAWVGWIGASVDIVEKGKWSAYFNPDVETILGHRVRSFEAVQANYSLEIGARRDTGRGRATAFLHHVSRHVQDREKLLAVDWNFLGVRYDSPWPEAWSRRGGWAASYGVATLSSGVHYDWEARLSGDIDLVRKGAKAMFVMTDLRHVGSAATPAFKREGFTDVRAEAGFRHWSETRQFALFVAYQHRHDALIPRPLVIRRALFGFRIRGHRRAAPALLP